MHNIFPFFAIAAGIYAALGIWYPHLRAHWKGSKITCGAVSCAGFALFFITMGAVFFLGDYVPVRHRVWFFFPVMIGWILGAIGYVLDSRAHARSSSALAPESPGRHNGSRSEQRGWVFVAFGIFFFLMVIWHFVIRK